MAAADVIPYSDCISTEPTMEPVELPNLSGASVLGSNGPSASEGSTPPSPKYTAPAYGIMRQIGDHKWWSGASYLEYNPSENEVEVAAFYTGWKWILKRTDKPYMYEKVTYWNGNIVQSSMMDATPVEQSDDEDNEASN